MSQQPSSCNKGLHEDKLSGSTITFVFLLITVFLSISSSSWLIYYTYYNGTIDVPPKNDTFVLKQRKTKRKKQHYSKKKKEEKPKKNIVPPK